MEFVQQNVPQLATYSVPEAGRLLGLGRDKAYEEAKKGTFPVLRFGRLLRVPCAAFHKMLRKRWRSPIIGKAALRMNASVIRFPRPPDKKRTPAGQRGAQRHSQYSSRDVFRIDPRPNCRKALVPATIPAGVSVVAEPLTFLSRCCPPPARRCTMSGWIDEASDEDRHEARLLPLALQTEFDYSALEPEAAVAGPGGHQFNPGVGRQA